MNSYPWYIANWRTCKDVLKMTAEEQGVYRNLLDMAWEWGDLPTDRAELLQLSLVKPEEFDRAWPFVGRMFVEIDGRLHNRMVDERRPYVLQQKEARADKARVAARKRWDEASAKQAAGDAPSMAPAEKHAPSTAAQDAPSMETGEKPHAPCMKPDAPSMEKHTRHPSSVNRQPSTVNRPPSSSESESSSSSSSSSRAPETTTRKDSLSPAEHQEHKHTPDASAEYLAGIRKFCLQVAQNAGSEIKGEPTVKDCRAIYAAFRGDRVRIKAFFQSKYDQSQGPSTSWWWFVASAREDAAEEPVPPSPASDVAHPPTAEKEKPVPWHLLLEQAKQILDRWRGKDSTLGFVAKMLHIADCDLSLIQAYVGSDPAFIQVTHLLTHFRSFVRGERYRRKREATP
jgi:uncharacterized protein YdaU (DUF1376 family)